MVEVYASELCVLERLLEVELLQSSSALELYLLQLYVRGVGARVVVCLRGMLSLDRGLLSLD